VPATMRARWQPGGHLQAGHSAREFEDRKRVFEKELELTGRLVGAAVPLLAGTDSPAPNAVPGFSLHDELELLVRAGLSPLQALQAATIQPARFLGIQSSSGTVERGKRADLVLLDANPLVDIRNTRRIAAVILNGTLLARQTLQQMLEKAKAEAAGR
jgi:imidazolonepropionase-like amidohydrolase